MKLQEYRSKEILHNAGVVGQVGQVARTPDEVEKIARKIDDMVVVKAQVLVGGRGKAGGIKLAKTPADAREKAEKILGMQIKGITVKKVLVAKAVDIATESYVGITLDRSAKRAVIMVSPEGGVEIEQVAKDTPEKIYKEWIDPLIGLKPYKARYLMRKLYDDEEMVKRGVKKLLKLWQVFVDNHASLVEINPLVSTSCGKLVCVDAKIIIDDNGLMLRPDLAEMRDMDEENPEELEAKAAGLSFVKLEGNIGCVVNGAGLAMATMDVVKHFGGEPANFLDVGGSSNPEKVVKALEIITRDKNVRVILFNIFGGITRCDDIANGLVEAMNRFKPSVPVIVRLTGTNQEEGRQILKEKLGMTVFTTMNDVVEEAVKLSAAA